MYDYAHYNEQLLGNQSIIVTPQVAPGHDEKSAQRFAQRFQVRGYSSLRHLDGILEEEEVDLLYCIKSGQNDGIVSQVTKTVVHVVFGYCEPHGDVYAYVSEWLSHYASQGRYPWVPHVVVPLPECGDMREELGIPKDALVFGRHGGPDTFDLLFVRVVVSELAKRRPDLYFLFLGTDPFCEPHPRIIHLESTSDLRQKSRFIATCDAMLHGRHSGETFGLSIAEFSGLNKPVITYDKSNERAHMEILGASAFYYSDAESLTKILWTFEPNHLNDCRVYTKIFTPEAVMKQFSDVFLLGAV
jgi:hypothetical protein